MIFCYFVGNKYSRKPVTENKLILDIGLPISHLSPWKPSGHKQLKVSPVTAVHVPPLIHGLGSQGSVGTSEEHKSVLRKTLNSNLPQLHTKNSLTFHFSKKKSK